MLKGSFLLVVAFLFSFVALAVSLFTGYTVQVNRPMDKVTTVIKEVVVTPIASPSASVKQQQLPVRLLTPVATEVPKS